VHVIAERKGEFMMYIFRANGFDQEGHEVELEFLEMEVFTLTVKDGKVYLYYAGSYDQGFEYWIDPANVTIVREMTQEERQVYLFKGQRELHDFQRRLEEEEIKAGKEIDAMFPSDEDLID
jgi:hypothetical protein